MNACVCLQMCVSGCVCVRMCVGTDVCVRTGVCVCGRVCVQICVCECACVCVVDGCVFLCVCVFLCECVYVNMWLFQCVFECLDVLNWRTIPRVLPGSIRRTWESARPASSVQGASNTRIISSQTRWSHRDAVGCASERPGIALGHRALEYFCVSVRFTYTKVPGDRTRGIFWILDSHFCF